MRAETGTCKYCKQVRVIEVPDSMVLTQMEIDIEASEQCDCPMATHERKKQEMIARANAKIQEIIPFESKTGTRIREVLMLAAVMLSEYDIDNISIKFGSSQTKMKLTGNGGIKIEKKTTKTEGGEV